MLAYSRNGSRKSREGNNNNLIISKLVMWSFLNYDLVLIDTGKILANRNPSVS